MAKKPVEPFIAEYKYLQEINQKMKEICDFYIISNGMIYMHSLVDFIEKVAVIHTEIPLEIFNHLAILPNELFNYTKNARKTRMTFSENDDEIVLGDINDPELTIHLKKYLPSTIINQRGGEQVVEKYILDMINKLYNKYDILSQFNNLNYNEFDDSIVEALVGSKALSVNIDNYPYTITRNLFLNMKKDDHLSGTVLGIRDPDNPMKRYIIFKENNSCMDIFTIGAFIQI